MKEAVTTVVNPNGIHARPASVFVNEAKKFQSAITVENMANGKSKNAKAILGVMSLGMVKGTQIKLVADGPDEDEAISALVALVEAGCGE